MHQCGGHVSNRACRGHIDSRACGEHISGTIMHIKVSALKGEPQRILFGFPCKVHWTPHQHCKVALTVEFSAKKVNQTPNSLLQRDFSESRNDTTTVLHISSILQTLRELKCFFKWLFFQLLWHDLLGIQTRF